MTLPVLYSFRRCPYAMRARLALHTAQCAVELREVVLKAKPAELLQASPKGTVPVLVLPDGTVIDQSLDIMRWALQQRDPEGWLSAAPLAEQQALIERNDGPFKRWLDRYKYPERHPEQSQAEWWAQGARDHLQPLETQLQQQAQRGQGWLFGPQPSLADMALLPFVRQWAQVDAQAWQAAPWPALHAWLDHFLQHRLEAVMAKHPPWVAPTPAVR